MNDGNHEFFPLYPKHAIERCAWSIFFAQPIPEKLYSNGVTRCRELMLHRDLNPVPVQAIFLDAQGNVSINPEYGPIEFATPDGSHQLSITPDSLTWQTTRYVRWEPFKGQVEQIALSAAEPFIDAVSIGALKLEYWDRFIWTGPWETMPISELLNLESGLVSRRAIGHESAWHTHSGWFEPSEGAQRRLVNVNVDVASYASAPNVSARPSVGIYTMLQDSFAHPELIKIDIDISDAKLRTEHLHLELKKLLGEIICSDMQERISLHGGAGDGDGI